MLGMSMDLALTGRNDRAIKIFGGINALLKMFNI